MLSTLFIRSSLEAGGSRGPSPKEFRMKLHANARLSLIRRREMVEMVLEQHRSISEAARAAGVSPGT